MPAHTKVLDSMYDAFPTPTNRERERENPWLKTTGNNLRHAEDSGSKSSLPLQPEDHTTSK